MPLPDPPTSHPVIDGLAHGLSGLVDFKGEDCSERAYIALEARSVARDIEREADRLEAAAPLVA